MKINFLKIFGLPDKLSDVKSNATVQQAEKVVITETEGQVLSKVGVEPTVSGAIQYFEKVVDTAIESEDKLNDLEKAVLVGLVNNLGNKYKQI